jgi:cytidylate kinase
VANVILSGLTASGKTTHAKILAAELGFNYFNASSILKRLVHKEGDVWLNEWDVARKSGELDRELDQLVIHEFDSRDCTVFDAWALPWTTDSPAVRVWIESDLHSRTRKVIVSRLRVGETLEFDKSLKIALEKDEVSQIIFKKLHDFDLFQDKKVFDVIVSNTSLIENPTIKCSDEGIAIFSPVLLSTVKKHLGCSSDIILTKFQESLILRS